MSGLKIVVLLECGFSTLASIKESNSVNKMYWSGAQLNL